MLQGLSLATTPPKILQSASWSLNHIKNTAKPFLLFISGSTCFLTRTKTRLTHNRSSSFPSQVVPVILIKSEVYCKSPKLNTISFPLFYKENSKLINSVYLRDIDKVYLYFSSYCTRHMSTNSSDKSNNTHHHRATDEPLVKKSKMGKKIGTHNGTFHCDEALACFLIQLLPEYKDSTIIRTRDTSKLDECDIVVDVGGVFDEKKSRFDHHQRSFEESMNSLNPDYKWVTKLSSAGLVYYHFGHQIIRKLLELGSEDSTIVDTIYRKVYENFIEEIDGIDNGINQTKEEPKYTISTGISNRVKYLNPGWNEKDLDEEALFRKAMKLVGEEFTERVLFYKQSWIPAREIVLKAMEERKTVDESGEIVILASGGCPWKEHLLTLEEEKEISPSIKYVLYTDQAGNWRVQCVPVQHDGFTNRLSLPEEWRGLRDDELSEKSGIKNCIFVHATGFIGGNKTYEGALEMARTALKDRKES